MGEQFERLQAINKHLRKADRLRQKAGDEESAANRLINEYMAKGGHGSAFMEERRGG